MTTANGTERDANMKREYLRVLNDIPDKIFESRALKTAMMSNMHGSGQDLKGSQLWNRFKSTQLEIKNRYNTNLPTQLRILPSGHSMRDARDAFILARYKEDFVSIDVSQFMLL